MADNKNYNRKSVVAAAIAAGAIIIVFSIAYRNLAARLAIPVNGISLPPVTLKQLPLTINSWTGYEAPLDEEIIRATDTDAHVNRIYSRHKGTESVSLFIAYGVRARDLMPHRPEVCYTGAGWTLIDKLSRELLLSDGTKLPCNIFYFNRGTLNTKKTVVLDYYIVDGEYCRDVSLLRSKVWHGSGTVNYVAQIQIVASTTVNLNSSSTERTTCAFAIDSASSIFRLFEHAENTRLSNEVNFDKKSNFGGTDSDS